MVRSVHARAFIAAMAILGIAELSSGGLQWQSSDLQRFICYLAISLTASILKVAVPGVTGTISVNFLFVLVGLVELSIPETLVIRCSATFMQCVWRSRSRPKMIQVLFNVANVAVAVSLAGYLYHLPSLRGPSFSEPFLLALVSCVYFIANTFPVASIIALTENKSFRYIWRTCYFWTFPYYMSGAGVAEMLHIANQHAGWQISIFVLPLVYVIFRSYRQYLGRLEGEKSHAEEVGG